MHALTGSLNPSLYSFGWTGGVKDATGSFQWVIIICAVCCLAGGLVLLAYPLAVKLEYRRPEFYRLLPAHARPSPKHDAEEDRGLWCHGHSTRSGQHVMLLFLSEKRSCEVTVNVLPWEQVMWGHHYLTRKGRVTVSLLVYDSVSQRGTGKLSWPQGMDDHSGFFFFFTWMYCTIFPKLQWGLQKEKGTINLFIERNNLCV